MTPSRPRNVWPVVLPIAGVLLLAGGAGAWWLHREGCRLTFSAHQGAASCLAVSADGRLLVTGGGDGAVRVWQLPSGAGVATFTGHTGEVAAVALSPDGSLVASGGKDGLKWWDVAGRSERSSTRGHKNGVLALLFTPDGQTLITGGADRAVRLWDVATGKERGVLRGQGGAVWSLAVSPDGQTLACGGSGDDVVHLWKLPARSPLGELHGHRARVLGVAFAGGTLASGDRNGTVQVWDLKTKTGQSFQAHHDRISGLATLPSSGGLVSASEDQELARWSLSPLPGTPIRWRQRSPIRALALAPDGSVVTAGADGRVRVWDVPES